MGSFSAAELLRWDSKQSACDGGLKVGIAAVCEPLPSLLRRSGGAGGLEEAMAEAAKRYVTVCNGM